MTLLPCVTMVQQHTIIKLNLFLNALYTHTVNTGQSLALCYVKLYCPNLKGSGPSSYQAKLFKSIMPQLTINNCHFSQMPDGWLVTAGKRVKKNKVNLPCFQFSCFSSRRKLAHCYTIMPCRETCMEQTFFIQDISTYTVERQTP